MVTYTAVSSPFGGLSDIGSPRVDGLPVMSEDPYAYVVAAFQAPPSNDYVPGLEYPHAPDFIPKPVYLEFMPLKDEVLSAEEQPLPIAVSPTADSPSYVPESGPEEDPEEDDDEDPKEDPADYPADGGDDGDDEDESFDDNEDDDFDIEGDEEEEEHPAPANSTTVALPAVDHAPSAEETEPFVTDESAATPPPHPTYLVTSRISIRDEPPTPFWFDTEATEPRYSAQESQGPIYFPFIPVHISLQSPHKSKVHHIRDITTPTYTNTYIITIFAAITALTDHGSEQAEFAYPPHRKGMFLLLGLRNEVVESLVCPSLLARPTRGFRADYGFVATLDREIRQDPEREVGYEVTDTWDEMLKDMPGAPTTDETELGGSIAVRDCRVAGSRPHLIGTTCGDIETDEDTTDIGDSSPESVGTR
ncbi:hypothetical protein Tco_1450293 [Tanacetum coccineum]